MHLRTLGIESQQGTVKILEGGFGRRGQRQRGDLGSDFSVRFIERDRLTILLREGMIVEESYSVMFW